MKIRDFIIILALACLGSFATTYASLPANTPEFLNQQPAQNQADQNQTSTLDQKTTDAAQKNFGVQPQTQSKEGSLTDAEKEAILAKFDPRVAENLKRANWWPPDNDPYGCESMDRLEFRKNACISANGMRAKDSAVNMIRDSGTNYQNNAIPQGVVCGDQSAMITPYLLTGIDPTLYQGGAKEGVGNWSGSAALRNMGYDWYQQVDHFKPGDIVTGGMHAFDWWQTSDDALGKTSTPSGAGVSHWPDSGYATNLAYANNGSEGVYRLNHSPSLDNISNPDGSKGVVNQVSMQSSALTKYWMNLKETVFPEPDVYKKMRTNRS